MQPEKPKRKIEDEFIIIDEQAQLHKAAEEAELHAQKSHYEMTDEQRAELKSQALPEIALLSVLLGVFGLPIVLFLIGSLTPNGGDPSLLCGVLLAGVPFIALLYSVYERVQALNKDLNEGQVHFLEGNAHVYTSHASRGGIRHHLRMGKRTFEIKQALFDNLQDSSTYRVYYAPNSGHVVGGEPP